ncbi:hypothetical protein NHX12_003521 [Muraenolepis orangiensis]|uniref:Solute carrier family 13 member 1 n=1 Tax=Muraenolepis orangiensis TaxID=630683 RepID=A0A9Q0E0K2_9TELE|nr:hypothetical protein NHX12_003521 [Muraenolepis orangiensis]
MSVSWLRSLWNHRSLLLVVAACAFVLVLMALFWALEPLPLAMTAMLPAILFPLFGIMTSSEVAGQYFKDFHFLLVGVICLATSIEKWGLHRRIALKLITLVGVNPAWLMLGFMSGCAFLSMWVHNTSAVTMVMPIVEAVIQQVLKVGDEEEAGPSGIHNPALELDALSQKHQTLQNSLQLISRCDKGVIEMCDPGEASSRGQQNVCRALCLGVAYSSNIGGISTLPGTSPNLIFSQYIHQIYPDCNSINFGNWLLLCLPISVLMLLLSWLWLYWLFIGSDFRFLWRCDGDKKDKHRRAARVIQQEYNSLGPMSPQEIVTMVLFVLLALLWLTREPGFIAGWASLFPEIYSGFTSDSTVALLVGLLLFIIPANRPTHKYESLISWEEFQSCMPWEVVLLVGGGFALAEGTRVSGLSSWMAQLLVPLGDLPVLATVLITCVIVTTAGLGLNVIGLLAVLLAVTTWAVPLFSLHTFPDWGPLPTPVVNSTGL